MVISGKHYFRGRKTPGLAKNRRQAGFGDKVIKVGRVLNPGGSYGVAKGVVLFSLVWGALRNRSRKVISSHLRLYHFLYRGGETTKDQDSVFSQLEKAW